MKNILCISLFVSILLCLFAVIDPSGNLLWFHHNHNTSWASLFINSNHFGYYLSIFVSLLAIMLCFAEKKWFKIFTIIAFVFVCFVLFFNNTLGTILAIFAALVLLPFGLWLLKGKLKFKYFIPLIIFIVVSILSSFVAEFVASSYNSFWKDLLNLTSETGEIIKDPTSDAAAHAGTDRWKLWLNAFDEIAYSPIIGTGNIHLRPHNEYLQFAQVWGIPSVIIYLSAFIMIVVKSIKHRKKLSDLTIVILFSVLTYMISAFFGNTMPHTYPFFMLFVGFLIRTLNDDIKKDEKVETQPIQDKEPEKMIVQNIEQ